MTFDPLKEDLYFLPDIDRIGAENLLENRLPGTFLIRKSISVEGDLALTLKETGKVVHYRIECERTRKSKLYVICGMNFSNLSDLISFYQRHLIDEVELRSPINLETEPDNSPYVPKPPSSSKVVSRLAKVTKQRVPSPYENNALKLDVDDIVLVIETNVNGESFFHSNRMIKM